MQKLRFSKYNIKLTSLQQRPSAQSLHGVASSSVSLLMVTCELSLRTRIDQISLIKVLKVILIHKLAKQSQRVKEDKILLLTSILRHAVHSAVHRPFTCELPHHSAVHAPVSLVIKPFKIARTYDWAITALQLKVIFLALKGSYGHHLTNCRQLISLSVRCPTSPTCKRLQQIFHTIRNDGVIHVFELFIVDVKWFQVRLAVL